MSRAHHLRPATLRALPRVTTALVTTLGLLLQLAGPVAAGKPDTPAVPATSPGVVEAADRVIVRWRNVTRGAATARAHGLKAPAPLALGNAPAVVPTNGRPVSEVLDELRADPNVLSAEPDYQISVDSGPGVVVNDPQTGGQYSLDLMHVREAWSITTGADNAVAVLDTGVQFTHPDLAGRLLAGYDFVNDDADAADDNGHGTWVSGIIAANANDGIGVAGISWSDKILPVKIMNADGLGWTSYLISGIRWAADHGASVINMSIGGFPASSAVQDAVNYAWSKGVVLVGAAGNNRRLENHYPASFDHVISVTATQMDDEFTNFSNYGPKVDVSAPGGSVLTTNCNRSAGGYGSCHYYGDTITISGTSFASPNTAGVVALIRAVHPDWTPQQVVDRLIATVDDLGYPGWDNRYGWGRVNAYRAVGGSIAAITSNTHDALEPNDVAAKAHLLALGTTTEATIHPAGDEDWYAVDLPRAGRLDVTVTAVTDTSRPAKSALPVDPVVELAATDGTSLLVVDDQSSSAATELASLHVTAARRILIHVTNWLPNGSRVPYTIRPDYVDDVSPTVSARFPDGDATEILRFVSPIVTFDEPVTEVTSDTVTLRDTVSGALVPATVTYDAARRRALVRIGRELDAKRTYELAVGNGLRDPAGNLIAPTAWIFTTGSYGFYDVVDSPFQREIGWLVLSGITNGCGDGIYCPTAPVTREQMASFLVRAMGLPGTTTDFFTDDDASPHESNINRLAAAHLTNGCAPGRFCPTEQVTRAQMASFLVRALKLPAVSTDLFSDDAGSIHEADINALAAAGITSGCGSGRFCPNAAVTREQMAAFLKRAFG